jgi:hypothetical protein
MSDYQKHLYLVLYPNEALIASQLTPEEFGKHYSIGSPRHFTGKVIFAEVDTGFRHESFRIDEYLKLTESGIPGRPKRTKFVKSYRVLEHVDFSALQKLFLVTTDGAVLGLEKSELPAPSRVPHVRLYQEICPLQLLVPPTLSRRSLAITLPKRPGPRALPKSSSPNTTSMWKEP